MFIIVWGSGLIKNILLKNTFEKHSWVIDEKNSLELRGRPDETNHINKAKVILNQYRGG